ncbi:MAG: aromatic ring-hydroxylating dioxygenase subunit alpha [Gammaproteobacteria bacterium]|nr:aromatic ring-hydroxylating dioxygenase subunit alpha [Gammaproteobacteria bacterium]
MNAPKGPSNPITTTYEGLGTGPVSTLPNRSQELFELEREKVFRSSWIPGGLCRDIPNPGDYYVKDYAVLNSSLIIVRGQDHKVRAFHNACPHRGNKVASGTGNTKGFACGFHGWTFDNQGALVFVPDEEQFFDFDKKNFCLKEVNCDTWEGFVFVNFSPDEPTETLLEWVGEIDNVHGFPFEEWELIGHWRASDVHANWKIVLDAFQEAYHAPFVHGTSLPDAFSDAKNPYSHIFAVDLYKRNRRMSVYAPDMKELRPAEELAMKHGGALAQGTSKGMGDLPSGVNPERTMNWGFDINVIFPNFRFLPGPAFMVMDNFWPLAMDRSIFDHYVFMPKAKNAGAKISQEYTRCLLRDLLREDLSTVEAAQRAILSGAMPEMMLSDMEVGVRHSYKVWQDAIDS